MSLLNPLPLPRWLIPLGILATLWQRTQHPNKQPDSQKTMPHLQAFPIFPLVPSLLIGGVALVFLWRTKSSRRMIKMARFRLQHRPMASLFGSLWKQAKQAIPGQGVHPSFTQSAYPLQPDALCAKRPGTYADMVAIS